MPLKKILKRYRSARNSKNVSAGDCGLWRYRRFFHLFFTLTYCSYLRISSYQRRTLELSYEGCCSKIPKRPHPSHHNDKRYLPTPFSNLRSSDCLVPLSSDWRIPRTKSSTLSSCPLVECWLLCWTLFW